MRDSLKKSLTDTPAQGFERYPKGSVIICNACAGPIYKLDRALDLGQGLGRSVGAFKPLTLQDLATLEGREDIDAGVRSFVRGLDLDARKTFVGHLREPRAGEPVLCPVCHDCFVQVLSTEKHELMDLAYTVELLSISPVGQGRPAPIRGRQIGAGPGKEWLH
jgi:hypothetical protein